jgi:hypothetical protein
MTKLRYTLGKILYVNVPGVDVVDEIERCSTCVQMTGDRMLLISAEHFFTDVNIGVFEETEIQPLIQQLAKKVSESEADEINIYC